MLWKPEPLKWIAGAKSTRDAFAPQTSHLVTGSSLMLWRISNVWPLTHRYS